VADGGARPRAWGVLAVALALMALIVALSSTAGHEPLAPSATKGASRTTNERAGPNGSASPSTSSTQPRRSGVRRAPLHAARTPSATTHQLGGRGVTGAGRATGGSSDALDLVGVLGLSGPTSKVAAANVTTRTGSPLSPGSASPEATAGDANAGDDVSATTQAGPSVTSSDGATAPSGADPGSGRIAPPQTSATFGAAGGGLVTAEATWEGSPTLELSVTCAGGVSVSRTGTSGLSVEVDDSGGSGTCQITLSLPQGVTASVTYTLAVEPA
jgi:hypothetical protein